MLAAVVSCVSVGADPLPVKPDQLVGGVPPVSTPLLLATLAPVAVFVVSTCSEGDARLLPTWNTLALSNPTPAWSKMFFVAEVVIIDAGEVEVLLYTCCRLDAVVVPLQP